MQPEEYLKAFFKKYPGWEGICEDGGAGLCYEATTDLAELFPELRRVFGSVTMLDSEDEDTRPWPHWWCLTEVGEIVDPTRGQFPAQITYKEWEDQDNPPIKCMNCGCLSRGTFCSDTCEKEFHL